MYLPRRRKYYLSGVFSVFALGCLSLPVMAQDSDRSMETVTQNMQVRGQSIIEQKTAFLQPALAAETVLQYESQLALQAAESMDQVALAVNIDPEPAISVEPDEMLASAVIPEGIEIDCEN